MIEATEEDLVEALDKLDNDRKAITERLETLRDRKWTKEMVRSGRYCIEFTHGNLIIPIQLGWESNFYGLCGSFGNLFELYSNSPTILGEMVNYLNEEMRGPGATIKVITRDGITDRD